MKDGFGRSVTHEPSGYQHMHDLLTVRAWSQTGLAEKRKAVSADSHINSDKHKDLNIYFKSHEGTRVTLDGLSLFVPF